MRSPGSARDSACATAASSVDVDVPLDHLRQPRRLRSDQVHRPHVRPDCRRERREVLAFRRAAEDQVDRLPGVGCEPAERRSDVRRLAVVDVADAVALADELEPVRNPGKAKSADAIASSPIPAARAAAVAAAAFSRLCAPRSSGSAGNGSSAANPIPSRPRPRGTTSPARARRCAASRRDRPRTCRGGRGGQARG